MSLPQMVQAATAVTMPVKARKVFCDGGFVSDSGAQWRRAERAQVWRTRDWRARSSGVGILRGPR